MTYLVFANAEQLEIVGYFTLANKFVSIPGDALSKPFKSIFSNFRNMTRSRNTF